MTRRIYFLSPDVDSVRAIVDELRELGIPQRHIYVIGSVRYAPEELPERADPPFTDMVRGVEVGMGVGGTAGLLGGLLAVTFPPAGLVLGGGALLLATLTGAGFGGLVSGLIARDQPNHDLEAFEENIARGELLVLVDAPLRRVEEVKAAILRHHPEAEVGVAHPPD